MPNKVTDPNKIITDPVLLSVLAKQGIDKDYVEFFRDYASRSLGKEHNPYAKFYRDLKSNKRFMVVSGLPMVDADGVKIEVGWRVAGINYFTEKNNLFRGKVQDTDVELTIRNDQPDGRKAGDRLSYKPQLFLNGIEINWIQQSLLLLDPINSSTCQCHPTQPAHYVENTLEWDYGICKRRLRIIEGSILGSWVFPVKPVGEVRIKYNQIGDYKLRLGQFKVSDDEEVIQPEDFDRLAEFQGYPVTISDSATYYPDPHTEVTTVDGRAAYYVAAAEGVAWATIHDSAGTDGLDNELSSNFCSIFSGTTTNYWRLLIRAPFLLDVTGLPVGAVVGAPTTFSLRGSDGYDGINWDIAINLYLSNPTTNTAVIPGDYNIARWSNTTPLSTTKAIDSWLVDGTFNDFTLNAAGRAVVQAAADGDNIVKLGVREVNYEVANSPPTWSSYQHSYFSCYWSEKGNGYKPKLVVTYTTPKPSSCMAAKLVAAGLI